MVNPWTPDFAAPAWNYAPSPHATATYKTAVERSRAQRTAAIAEQGWLLPDVALPGQDVLDVTTFYRSCGLLNAGELAVVESDAPTLVRRIAARELSAVDVLVAFAKSASVAHQVVRRLPFPLTGGLSTAGLTLCPFARRQTAFRLSSSPRVLRTPAGSTSSRPRRAGQWDRCTGCPSASRTTCSSRVSALDAVLSSDDLKAALTSLPAFHRRHRRVDRAHAPLRGRRAQGRYARRPAPEPRRRILRQDDAADDDEQRRLHLAGAHARPCAWLPALRRRLTACTLRRPPGLGPHGQPLQPPARMRRVERRRGGPASVQRCARSPSCRREPPALTRAAVVYSSGSPLGVGTDLGGSIRLPSAFCYQYGLKPSYGRTVRIHVAPLVGRSR